MNNEKLKVGIIGLGIGQKHLEAYLSHPMCKIAAICDLNDEKLNQIGNEYPSIQLCSSDLEILHHPDIDVVSIASYDNFHMGQIREAVKHNKHIYVEKPMCQFKNEALEIRKLLDNNPQIKLSSNLVLRTCPKFANVKKAVSEGNFGSVFSVEADYLWGRIHKLGDAWRSRMDYYSIISGAAIHMIDLTIWTLGLLPYEVYCVGNQIATQNTGLRFNDYCNMLLKFPNDTVAKISAHGGCVHPHFHQMKVYGTKKTFIHTYAESYWLESENSEIPVVKDEYAYPGKEHRKDTLNSFIDSILDPHKKPLVSANDVFNSLSICFAAEKSLKEQKPIKIEYI